MELNVIEFLKRTVLNIDVPRGVRAEALDFLIRSEVSPVKVTIPGRPSYGEVPTTLLIPANLIESIKGLGVINAIKAVRDGLNVGLFAAKSAVDELERLGKYTRPKSHLDF